MTTKTPAYSYLRTALGKRFQRAVKKRGVTVIVAVKEMGYAFPTAVYPILAGVPGRAGKLSLARVTKWVEENE